MIRPYWNDGMVSDSVLFLPISKAVVCQAADQTLTDFSELSHAEVAALVVIQLLSEYSNANSPAIEKKLAEILAFLQTSDGSADNSDVLAAVLSKLDSQALQRGLSLMPAMSIACLSEEDVTQSDYLLTDGMWDFSFRERHAREAQSELVSTCDNRGESHFLTEEQSRYFREISAQSDDHIHIQGYAGTGKTTLIKSLLQMYESSTANVLVLADTRRQMQSLNAAVVGLSRVTVSTFGAVASKQLMDGVAPCANTRMRWWDTSPTQTPDAVMIAYLGIQRSGELSENQLVQMVRATVFTFCMSADTVPMDKHIPARFKAVLDQISRTAVLAYAEQLWKAYVTRQRDNFKPKIRSVQQLKWLTLNGCGVPKQYTHIVVDECHDLSPVKLRFLELGGQAVISVGDEYQNLRGVAGKRSHAARQRNMHRSVRSSPVIESIVNPIIVSHSAETKESFVGNAEVKLACNYYSGAAVFPEKPSLILVKNIWGAFDWLEQARRRKVKFAFMGNLADLNAFVSDCIELFSQGTRARHGELFRFNSWQQVQAVYAADASFQRVYQLLSKGYSQREWQNTKALARKTVANDIYTISTVENAKNHEFHRVFLADNMGINAKAGSVDDLGAAVYLSVTRAQQSLTLPQSLRDWIEGIA